MSGSPVRGNGDQLSGYIWRSDKLQGKAYFVEKMKLHSSIIREEFPEKSVTWSTHCHNDFGLALDNSLNAVFDGPARQIEGCINADGERARKCFP